MSNELFNGIAVLIDDEHGAEYAEVTAISNQIRAAGGHVVAFTELPSDVQRKNFGGAAFFVVDWNLHTKLIRHEDGSVEHPPRLPWATVRKPQVDELCQFILDLRSLRFAPVFIFTNEDPERVEDILEEKYPELGYKKGQPTHIFVKSKKEVVESGVFSVLNKWIEETPSAYLLKRWEKEYEAAKNDLFIEFCSRSVHWPVFFWDAFKGDELPAGVELGQLITRNIQSRMVPFDLNLEPFTKNLNELHETNPEEYQEILARVLEGERFVSKLHEDSISPGDVFCLSKDQYLINVRAECDCVIREDNQDPELYLLSGGPLTSGQLGKLLNLEFGNIIERDTECVVFAMHEGKSIRFQFNDLKIQKWSQIKGKRIGRLIPPFSTRLQQRYAAYLQRPGLSRIPRVAIPPATLKIIEAAQACAQDMEQHEAGG